MVLYFRVSKIFIEKDWNKLELHNAYGENLIYISYPPTSKILCIQQMLLFLGFCCLGIKVCSNGRITVFP